MSTTRIVIGCDHAAVALKDEIVKELRGSGQQVEDVGTFTGDSVDYPDFAAMVAGLIRSGTADLGIVMCGTGIGVSIAANKLPGIRAALCHDVTTARLARQHNDSNILCMGGRVLGSAVALDIVRTWLSTPFEGGRHLRRIRKIEAIESQACAPEEKGR
ncbi:MAG TPA: ribose 5-phosphate isomerase B [Candidatus Polarisedimenticolia bacterium]|jgi:ribose 5-phosphate isomerase B